MFRRLPDAAHDLVRFTIDGREAVARRGDSVAVALLAEGVAACRTTPSRGLPRGPYCLMGVCFDCLVVIDGIGSRQGCLVTVAEGMRVETQQGARAFPQEAPA
jgi:predicted molibdopterin-dependent oxidoreductase YjgC